MAIKIRLNNPNEFIKEIKYQIEIKNIKDWMFDLDGDFTLDDEKWKNRAWFRPYVFKEENIIIFSIIGRNDVNLRIEEFSIYHSKFIEMLIFHFYSLFDKFELLPIGNQFDPSEFD